MLIVALATWCRLLLDPVFGDAYPFVTIVLAMPIAAFYAGVGPALLSLPLGLLAADYFILPPREILSSPDPGSVAGLVAYGAVSLALIALIHAERAARRRAEACAAAAQQNQEALAEEVEGRQAVEVAQREAQRRFESFMGMLPGFAWIKDREGRYVYLNHAAIDRLLGGRSDWQGKTAYDLWPHAIAAEAEANDQKVLRTHAPLEAVERYVQDGAIRYRLVTKFPLADATGAVAFVAGLGLEVTDRLLAEQAKEATTEQLLAITQAMSLVLEGGSWKDVSEMLLEAALRQTQSKYGFIGVVVEGPVLRILAHAGIVWSEHMNRDFYEHARRTYETVGYLEFTNLETLFGRVITEKQVVLSNDPAHDPRSGGGVPPGHPPLNHFLGVPVFSRQEVVGLIGVANRPGGYTGTEVETLDILTKAVGVLYESYRRKQEQAALEERLRQAQKMDAVGRLVGGIAHDFNNMLTVINGYSAILLSHLPPEDPSRQQAEQITQAGRRAADLMQKLLAFSRRQVLQPVVLGLNQVVADFEEILRRLIREDIQLRTVLAADLGLIKADRSQLEQVLMNLVLNARDAMPDGGHLTITTENLDVPTGRKPRPGHLHPGAYVVMRVSDTGHGMTPETKARLFEPFFTTKEPGKGTGLGLATVYGIVHQSGGQITVDSEWGQGSTFTIYLPQANEAVSAEPAREPDAAPFGGTETVLLAEDDPGVRQFIRAVLQRFGYTVLEAPDGPQALVFAKCFGGVIHLLVTDVVMPEMSGRTLAEQLQDLRPEIRVLYVSGHAEDAIVHHGLVEPGLALLPKPFTPEVLARRVRRVLDQPSPHSRP